VNGGARAVLDAALLEAHGAGDRAALIELYARAGEADPDPRARSFYLTHAYVFALEAGDPRALGLRARLVSEGAEAETP
jgi:GNAT superfamily N-acetyltransferase